MSTTPTTSATDRARIALAVVGAQAQELAGACLRASQGNESEQDREIICDALGASIKGGGTRGLVCQQEAERDLFPILMMWLYPGHADVEARYQRYLSELEASATE